MDNHLARSSLGLVVVISLVTAWILGQWITVSFQSNSFEPMPQIAPFSNNRNFAGEDSFLFGSPEQITLSQTPKRAINTEKVMATRLNLKLIGVIDLGDRGVAILQNGSKTQVVAQNESLMPSVILLDVFADGILIDNHGKQERLLLDQNSSSLVNQVARTSSPVSTTLVGRLSEGEQKNLNAIGDLLRKQPMSISKYIKFQPINENGQWVGVKIWSNSDATLYKSIGFAEGDILRQVNGHTIQEMVKDPKLWQTFLSLDQFDLVVERDGAPQMINVNFR